MMNTFVRWMTRADGVNESPISANQTLSHSKAGRINSKELKTLFADVFEDARQNRLLASR